MTYRLLVLDLDGTVMTRDLTISDAVVGAIRRAQERGVIVTIATGRVYNSTMQFLPAIGIDSPVITFQGASIRNPSNGEIIHEANLDRTQAARAIDHLHAGGMFTIAFHGNETYVERWTDELDLYLSFHPGGEADVRIVPDLREFVMDNDPIKLLFATLPENLDQVVASLTSRMAGAASVLRSHEFFGEVTAPGIHKGSAIERLAMHLGIPREQVMAIGDEENDLPMIEWAGLGVAMASAPESVTSRADAVVPSIDEDGVAAAIELFLLS